MSFFGKIFSGKKEEKVPTTEEAIHKLRDTEELLNKKQEYLEMKIDEELAIAKKNASKNKRLAIQALKRKKRYAKQLEQIDGTLTTLEAQRDSLESASSNTSVLAAMKDAADAIRVAHKNLNVDSLNDLMDDIAEQQDVSREISEAISNPIGFGMVVDNDELEKELEELEQESLDDKLLDINPALPDVPKAAVANHKNTKKVEDEDYKELEAWAL